ncbi:hypothetical protein FB639_001959 [Coemansia asiatica]|nr:hypothetical protein FB639_001959 [Coemansia asiatica]
MIKREVRLSGRIAYIVNGKFNNNDAVLKLSWTLNGRLPENAIYDVLNDKGIKRIPKMFSRGLLFEDFEGYRLEYMVMEKCGMTLFEALNNLYSKNPEHIKW